MKNLVFNYLSVYWKYIWIWQNSRIFQIWGLPRSEGDLAEAGGGGVWGFCVLKNLGKSIFNSTIWLNIFLQLSKLTNFFTIPSQPNMSFYFTKISNLLFENLNVLKYEIKIRIIKFDFFSIFLVCYSCTSSVYCVSLYKYYYELESSLLLLL